jgi:hypothetical protein
MSFGAAKSRLLGAVPTFDAARDYCIRAERIKDFALRLSARREVTSNTRDFSSLVTEHLYLPTSISTSNNSDFSVYVVGAGSVSSEFMLALDSMKLGNYFAMGSLTYSSNMHVGSLTSWDVDLGRAIYPAAVPASSPAMAAPTVQSNSAVQLERLRSAVLGIFPKATMELSTHSDVEEGWTRPLLTVETGIDDPELLSELEYEFYEKVENHETLTAALNETTVLFL